MATYFTQHEDADAVGVNYEDLTLEEIQRELIELIELADQGYDIDERRFDWLLQAQEANEEYQEMMEIERRSWRESIEDFVRECLERTRTFVPVNIFDCTTEDLLSLGLSEELAKRLQQRQCLWLVRMGQDEISRLHESDLLGRFNCQQQHLDIIETAAVYASLPEEFRFDPAGRKKEWRASIEDTLRQMLMENDQDLLPMEKIRNPCYEGKQFGPVTDITSVRYVEIHKATDVRESRKSFIAICKEHSIMSRFNSINGRSKSATIKVGNAQRHDDGTITPPPSRQERVDGEPDDGEDTGTLLPEEVEELAEEAEIHLRSSLANSDETILRDGDSDAGDAENEDEAEEAAEIEVEETEIDALTEALADTVIKAEIEAEEEEEELQQEKEEAESSNESCVEASEECDDEVSKEVKDGEVQREEEEERQEQEEEEGNTQSHAFSDHVSNHLAANDEEKEKDKTATGEEEGEEKEEHSEEKALRTAEDETDEESTSQLEKQENQAVADESEFTPDEESETY